jgi:hypothetical protein
LVLQDRQDLLELQAIQVNPDLPGLRDLQAPRLSIPI